VLRSTGPFFLPLFTQARGREILGSSYPEYCIAPVPMPRNHSDEPPLVVKPGRLLYCLSSAAKLISKDSIREDSELGLHWFGRRSGWIIADDGLTTTRRDGGERPETSGEQNTQFWRDF
jgi:hypothetical protein